MPLRPQETEVFPENLFDLSTGDAPWLVIHVKSRQEKLLARYLERHNIPFYLPQFEKTAKRNGRTFKSFIPLFAGYVFVRASATARDMLRRTDVVSNILEVDDQELIDRELAQLRKLQLTGAWLSLQSEIAVGTPVRVSEGVFAGYTGTVVRAKEGERLIVMISHLHRAIAVELRPEALVKTSGNHV